MRASFPWILAGAGAGVAAYLLLRQPSGLHSDSGLDGVDEAGNRTSLWGDKQRVAGAGSNILGKVKEGFGRLTGDPNLAAEGATDQAAGSVRNAVGSVANAAGQTLKDLNI